MESSEATRQHTAPPATSFSSPAPEPKAAGRLTTLLATVATLIVRVQQMEATQRRLKGAASQLGRSQHQRRHENRPLKPAHPSTYEICWYHQRFGARARRCKAPCSFSHRNKGRHRSRQTPRPSCPPTPTYQDSSVCWYHQRFGAKARRCESLCSQAKIPASALLFVRNTKTVKQRRIDADASLSASPRGNLPKRPTPTPAPPNKQPVAASAPTSNIDHCEPASPEETPHQPAQQSPASATVPPSAAQSDSMELLPQDTPPAEHPYPRAATPEPAPPRSILRSRTDRDVRSPQRSRRVTFATRLGRG